MKAVLRTASSIIPTIPTLAIVVGGSIARLGLGDIDKNLECLHAPG